MRSVWSVLAVTMVTLQVVYAANTVNKPTKPTTTNTTKPTTTKFCNETCDYSYCQQGYYCFVNNCTNVNNVCGATNCTKYYSTFDGASVTSNCSKNAPNCSLTCRTEDMSFGNNYGSGYECNNTCKGGPAY